MFPFFRAKQKLLETALSENYQVMNQCIDFLCFHVSAITQKASSLLLVATFKQGVKWELQQLSLHAVAHEPNRDPHNFLGIPMYP